MPGVATAQIAGAAVETRIEVLAWSDIVRAKMRRGVAQLCTFGAGHVGLS